tara:strand:+ start:533 stop:745 length:213 start_codon:yes stop_codon:yes gene_type:complete
VKIVIHIVWNSRILKIGDYNSSREIVATDRILNRRPSIKKSLRKVAQPWTYENAPVSQAVISAMKLIQFL